MTERYVRARSLRRWMVGGLALLLLWLGVVLLVVPAVIRSGYAERSLSFVNAVFTGRDVHDVDHYLGVWRALAIRVSLILVGVAVVGAGITRLRTSFARAFSSQGWTPVTAGTGALAAAWLGWWMGLLDVAAELVWTTHRSHPIRPPTEALWTTPLVGVVLCGILGWAVTWAGRFGKSGMTLHPAATVGVTFLLLPWIQRLHLGIHPVAGLVLALGLASQLSRPLVTAYSGRERLLGQSFRWMTGFVLATALAVPAGRALSESAAIRGLNPAPAGAPNVLLIILDTARAKTMSLYGAARPTTPNIDRLAEKGTVFQHALAPAPWTLPSHASYFTGLPPADHGANWETGLEAEYVTLAEVLSDHGYVTGGFVANHTFTARGSGLEQGFVRYRVMPTNWRTAVERPEFLFNTIKWLRKTAGDFSLLSRKRAEVVNREFLAWLEDDVPEDRPFFAFLNYYDVHAPYDAPSPFDTIFPAGSGRYWLETWGSESAIDTTEYVSLSATYDESFRYLDHHIGALIGELERRGVLDNTLVVITSDHGEQFGEHGLLNHGNSLYMPVLRVPMVVLGPPGVVPEGVRVQERVGLRHIPATIVDLTGIDADLPGGSLAQYWSGDGVEDPIFTRVDLNAPSFARRGVVSGAWSYIRNLGGEVPEELYNLDADPEELLNLATVPPDSASTEALERLRTLTDSLMARETPPA